MSTILIAYEREMEQIAIEKLLTERGHTVIRASNGVDALEIARRELPNLIISDISLPKMDGFSLCKKWKQDEHLQTVPFMLYTRRHNNPKYERFALELGVDRFVERTADPGAFFHAVDEMLAAGVVARKADTMRLQALATGSFLATGKHTSTQVQLATTTGASPEKKNGDGGVTSKEERALAREARLLARIAELDAQNKQLRSGEEKLKETLDTQMRAAAHIADTYAALQVAAADGFLLLDADDRVREVNEAYCRLSGYTKDELLKSKITDLDVRWHEDSVTHADVLRDEGQLCYQSQHKRKDGSLFDVELSIGSLTGAQLRRVVIVRDVTARARRNAIVRRAERVKDAALEVFTGTETWDETELQKRSLALAATLTESPLAYLCSVDARQATVTLCAVFEVGQPAARLAGEQKILPASPWIDCVRSGKPQILENSSIEAVASLPAQQRALLLPIPLNDSILVLCIANRALAYTDSDAVALAPLVAACGATLRAKQTHIQTLRAAQRAELALQGSIEALSNLVERHDPQAIGISRRVAALAVALGRALELTQREQNALRIAALLHRVGQIAIPLALLHKPGELSPVELALVRTHVEESHKLLAGIEFDAPVAEIVYQHQERLDGSGYPRGLRGEQILLAARILAVAETVVTRLAKHNGHGKIESVLRELGAASGKFDSRVVEACTRLFREQGFVLPA